MKSLDKNIVHMGSRALIKSFDHRASNLVKKASSPLVSGLVLLFAASAQAQIDINPLKPLKSVAVPGPSDAALMEVVKDKAAAIQLGKALFWDPRVGSDNKTACATCHFGAGADSRGKNQVSPGLLSRSANLSDNPDNTFQLGGAPNYVLTARDFPLTTFNPVSSNDPAARLDVNDVISSQGVFNMMFNDIVGKGKTAADDCTSAPDPDNFSIHGINTNINTRRVEPRNSPTVINAVFNFRNFWDGRGNNMFNGGDPFGLRNNEASVWKFEAGQLRSVNLTLPSSSLASQASGPPLSGTEMSCRNRTFAKLGQKLLDQFILDGQTIDPADSVLGKHAKGNMKYQALVKDAFNKEYWQAPNILKFTKNDAQKVKSMDLRNPVKFDKVEDVKVSQMEANFSMFFAIAIQLYEATLVSDDTPFDRYMAGVATALSSQQVHGLSIFQGKGRCINCHGGAELTNASFRNVISQRLEKMVISNGSTKTYDNGFYNIGVRPTTDDIGIGGDDPFGRPLSESMAFAKDERAVSLFGNDFDARKYSRPLVKEVNVNGAFKTPGLRNVELTGPYFHNGGKGTLMQVVEFYNRGGDFAAENRENLAPDIQPLNLDEIEKANLVAFLLSLTDERVRYEKAPFDHPSLCLPNGHPGSTASVTNAGNGAATDNSPLFCLNAVGSGGSKTPLRPFMDGFSK
jgi:cytochrome c peroxidase